MSNLKAIPSPGKRKIKINRCGFTQAASETQVDDNHGQGTGNSQSPVAKIKEAPANSLEPPPPKVAKVTRKEAQEAQTKIVDDLFKDFLVQKMAVIENERTHLESDKVTSLEKEREGMNEIIQDPTPFKEFLIQKMALIEKERETMEKSRERKEKAKKEEHSKEIERKKKRRSRGEHSQERSRKESEVQRVKHSEDKDSARKISKTGRHSKGSRKKESSPTEIHSAPKEENKTESTMTETLPSKMVVIEGEHSKDKGKKDKGVERVKHSEDKRGIGKTAEVGRHSKGNGEKETSHFETQTASKQEAKKTEPAMIETRVLKMAPIVKECFKDIGRKVKEVERAEDKTCTGKITETSKHSKGKEKKETSKIQTQNAPKKEEEKREPTTAETLAQKMAAIEKARKEAEKKAIKNAEEDSSKAKKHKSHKKDKKKTKEKSKHSRSHSRERSGEQKRKHRGKHKDRDKSADQGKSHRNRHHSADRESHRQHRRQNDELVAKQLGRGHRSGSCDNDSNPTRAKSPNPGTCILPDFQKSTDSTDGKKSEIKFTQLLEDIQIPPKVVHQRITTGDNHNLTVTITNSADNKPDINDIKLPDAPPPLPPVQRPSSESKFGDSSSSCSKVSARVVSVKEEPLSVHSKNSKLTGGSLQERLLKIANIKPETLIPPAASIELPPTPQNTQPEAPPLPKCEPAASVVAVQGTGAVADTVSSPLAGTASVKEAPQPAKKLGLLKMGLKLGIIKISQTSTELIQSGRRVDPDGKTIENLEEGEIDDSKDSTLSSDLSSTMSSTLSLTEDEQDMAATKKKKKKGKHRKKKKHKSDKDLKRKDKDSKKPAKKRHSKSRSRSGSRSKSQEHIRRRSRSRSSSRERDRSHRGVWRNMERHRARGDARVDRWPMGGRGYGGAAAGGRYRRRSRSRDRRMHTEEDLRLKIDKAKLREIAIANAYANMQTGHGPPLNLKADDIAAIKAGGKSVEELTDFCKRIAQKEGDCSSSSESELVARASDDEEGGPFIHHPFKVREAPNIVLNIRNAKQLPTLTSAEKMAQSSHLRLTFPVSSGSHHRDNEGEWVPVQKPTLEVNISTKKSTPSGGLPAAVPPLAPPPPPPLSLTASTTVTVTPAVPAVPAVPPVPAVPAVPPLPPPPPPPASIFPEPSKHNINIGAIVSERLSAMRKLQDNPHDVVAIGNMYKAQQQMNEWAASKQLPGQFTGTTGVQVLSQQELSGTDRNKQAWIKKDQFTRAAPVKSGIGMYLLQKMGWKQGEGLGKNKEGSTEPLMLDVKTDRKGLTSTGENVKRTIPTPVVKDLAGKHPVSALVELCTKRRWGSPDFIVVHESGPDHKKNFLYKVVVNGCEYQAISDSANKKLAKAEAATVCLQQLGMVPRQPPIAPPTAAAPAPPQPPQPMLRPPAPMQQGILRPKFPHQPGP